MNRAAHGNFHHVASIPHTRGDEPLYREAYERGMSVFPTPVGMNRIRYFTESPVERIPHTRGDEPLATLL